MYDAWPRIDVDSLNKQLTEYSTHLTNLLLYALVVDSYLELDTLKTQVNLPTFRPGKLALAEPPPIRREPQLRAVEEPTGIKRYLPWVRRSYLEELAYAQQQYAQELAYAQQAYNAELTAYNHREAARQQALDELRAAYEEEVSISIAKSNAQHGEIEKLKQGIAVGDMHAIETYFMLVLQRSRYPNDFPRQAKIAYVPASKQLVIEFELPPYERVPAVASYRYVRSRHEVTETPRPAAQRKSLYRSVVAQVTLRTLHEVFEADRLGHIETIVFNGYVDTIDPGTGLPIQPYLVTVRTTRDIFSQLDLGRVDPIACLAKLNASVSKKPDELAPVRPVVEFNMIDSRFIEEADVLSALDQRPNLMELSPSEFEALVSNLFQAMGLETRLTRASRDGGVDCIAYDQRPILGGKVVIQAKRYKNTVGVSAVRDLFGTVQNEGASKGILVTTSGYGKATFEFAQGKPLELLDGSNLLYLLKEHAGLEARIEVPDNWKDPHPDSGDAYA